jgi:PAS domain S-box-containing protein
MTNLLRRKLIFAGVLVVVLCLTGKMWALPGAFGSVARGFLPYGFVYLWNKQLLTLHVFSDAVLFLSYAAISITLFLLFFRLGKKIPLLLTIVCFGIFLLVCGLTHAMNIVVLWKPLYWLSGDIKLIAAMMSLGTAVVLPLLVSGVEKYLADLTNSLRNDRQFLTLANTSNDSFYVFESVRDESGDIVDFRFAFVNTIGADFLSGTPEGLKGQLLCERYPVNRTHGFFDRYKSVVETGEPFTGEFPIEANGINGSWMQQKVVKLGDGVAVTSQNISERKENEIQLAQVNASFRSLIEGVKDHAIFAIDLSGNVTGWNLGAARMLGYTENEIVGRSFSCIFSEDDRADGRPQEHLSKALQDGQMEDEGWRIKGDGMPFFANVNIKAMVDGPDPVQGYAVVVQDMTERRNVAIGMEEVRQERVRLREKFLSHVSHELRTPLTAIYFFTSNVLDGLFGDLTPAQHEHLALALDNVSQLKSMVGDLLDITRTESHKLSVVPRHVSPHKVAADAIGTCRRNAEVGKIDLHFDVPAELPYLWADPTRVRQILINLIDNGIKFTPPRGSVKIECRPYKDDGYLCMSVSDTGCGIGPEDLEKVFDRLAQVKNSAEWSRSGLGLGLFIARELVTRHGGEIWVESQLGVGSTFFFTLPVFSLLRMCAPVFSAPELEGSLALITVEIAAVEGTASLNVLAEIRRVLELNIRTDKDFLLPSMEETAPENTFFIVAATRPDGIAAVASRINKRLQDFDTSGDFMPLISTKILPVTRGNSREEQTRELAAAIEASVQTQLQDKEQLL